MQTQLTRQIYGYHLGSEMLIWLCQSPCTRLCQGSVCERDGGAKEEHPPHFLAKTDLDLGKKIQAHF